MKTSPKSKIKQIEDSEANTPDLKKPNDAIFKLDDNMESLNAFQMLNQKYNLGMSHNKTQKSSKNQSQELK
jgi:hypothetical protein